MRIPGSNTIADNHPRFRVNVPSNPVLIQNTQIRPYPFVNIRFQLSVLPCEEGNAMLRKSIIFTATVGLAAHLFAGGGFFLTLGNPAANSDPQAKNAVVVVRTDGCGEPAKAVIKGTAEAIVNGKRVSLPLKLARLSQPGTYAVQRDGIPEGTVVLSLVGVYEGRETGAIVPLKGSTFTRTATKFVAHRPTAAEVDAALSGQ
jgi:hypothetical protein